MQSRRKYLSFPSPSHAFPRDLRRPHPRDHGGDGEAIQDRVPPGQRGTDERPGYGKEGAGICKGIPASVDPHRDRLWGRERRCFLLSLPCPPLLVEPLPRLPVRLGAVPARLAYTFFFFNPCGCVCFLWSHGESVLHPNSGGFSPFCQPCPAAGAPEMCFTFILAPPKLNLKPRF